MPAGTPSPAPVPEDPPKSGIIVVDKPAGMTSHDVVQLVRAATGERRVGHAGTLDPAATGVLVVCIGAATRVVDAIQEQPKEYDATVVLGASTSTYDAEGEVTEGEDPSRLDREDVELALSEFRGPIMQVPPMYSALKRDGRPLYELARQGVDVEREARPVTVYELALTEFGPGQPEGASRRMELGLRLKVSKGTYVRSIAHDLGERLGTGAYLSRLRRTAVGRFSVDEAVSPDDVREAFAGELWQRIVHPLDQALVDWSALVGTSDVVSDAIHGRQFDGPPPGPDTTPQVRLYGPDGRFVAVVEWDPVSGRWQPERVFARQDGSRG